MNRRQFIKKGGLWLAASAAAPMLKPIISRAFTAPIITPLNIISESGPPDGLTWFWRHEAAALDGTHDYSAGDTTGAVSGGLLFNTDAAYSGTNGMDVPTTYDHCLFDTSVSSIVNATQGTIGFWFRVVSWGDDVYLWYAYEDSSNQIFIRLSGTDELRVGINNTSGNNSITTSQNLSTATWYFLQYQWNTVTNSHTLKVWNSSDTLIVDTTQNETLYAIDLSSGSMYFGNTTGTSADYHMDLSMISNISSEDLHAYRAYTSYTDF